MSADVQLPFPLFRLPPWFPGLTGVPGTDTREGIRAHPTGAVFYVDPNFPGASDLRDGTDPQEPLLTVAAALTKCQAFRGDTILVGANGGWQYGSQATDYETVIQEAVVVNTPGVRIVGASPSSPVGVIWTPPAAGGPCITINALDVLVEGFAFAGGVVGGTGISVDWNGLTTFGDNVVIRYCLFDDDMTTGIQLEFVWHADIHHCYFVECNGYGIRVDPAGDGIAFSHIHRNVFKDCATGALSLRGADDCVIDWNTIFDTDAQAAALATDQGIDLTQVGVGAGKNIVAHNTLSCLGPVPANGDYDDFCTAATADAWIQNYLMDGPSITNPT